MIVKFIITNFFEKFNCYLAIIAKTCRKKESPVQQVFDYLKYIYAWHLIMPLYSFLRLSALRPKKYSKSSDGLMTV